MARRWFIDLVVCVMIISELWYDQVLVPLIKIFKIVTLHGVRKPYGLNIRNGYVLISNVQHIVVASFLKLGCMKYYTFQIIVENSSSYLANSLKMTIKHTQKQQLNGIVECFSIPFIYHHNTYSSTQKNIVISFSPTASKCTFNEP